MSSEIKKFTIKENSTWEDDNGKLFVSISAVNVTPITVNVGAIGHDNVQKEMIPGDIIQYDATAYGQFEIRLRGFDIYCKTADFHIAKIG